MKKTFVAVAVLGAFAGSAMAADVTLYGKIDAGLNYINTNAAHKADVNKFSMATGQSAGNRFGLKGTEDLGDGWKVGFILENGFDADTGALKTYKKNDGDKAAGSKLFGREASINVSSDFGKLTFGRTGALSSGLTSTDVMAGFMAFGTGWSQTSEIGHFGLSDRTRMDNTVTYQTPRFAGVRVSAQYSFNFSDQEYEGNERYNKRYAGLGVDYANGPFTAGLVVDTVLNAHGNVTDKTYNDTKNTEDALGVTVGAAYDFEVAKVFVMGAYGQNENKMGKLAPANTEGVTGYWGQLGVTAPVAGGKVLATVSYADAEDEVNSNADMKAWGVGLGYQYNLSKRTYLYTFAGYNEWKLLNATTGNKDKTKETEFGFGLCHSF